MKTKTIVEDITHDDLVNLLETAAYGSGWLDYYFDKKKYGNKAIYDEHDTYTDKLAKLLLAGELVEVTDGYAEDAEDYYGDNMLYYDPEYHCMVYGITLRNIEEGIARAIDNGGWDAECANDLISDNGECDQPEAENLMQIIVFGESIYG